MVVRQSQTLVIKELVDSFTVETLDEKKSWMQVGATHLSLRDRKTAYRPGQKNHPLFDIVRERQYLRGPPVFSIQDPQSKKEYMKVRGRFSGKWLLPT